jgi:hypothetical protein
MLKEEEDEDDDDDKEECIRPWPDTGLYRLWFLTVHVAGAVGERYAQFQGRTRVQRREVLAGGNFLSADSRSLARSDHTPP